MPAADVLVAQPSTRALLDTAITLLPTIEHDGTAQLVEHMALAIVDLDDQLRTLQLAWSESLALAHKEHVENVRLHKRLVVLLDARRQPQRPAA